MAQGVKLGTFKYAAFLSYAHVDERIARRLHKALETYILPMDLRKTRRHFLKPIFRDVTELSAHPSLSERIQEAINHSRRLIVLCSPAAKASYWVNEEIRLFRKIHGEKSILCILIDGTVETAFPPALLENGREPLAATLEKGRGGIRLGTTQLAAGLLGVGFDDLAQRDQARRRRKAQLLSAGSLVFAGIMGLTTIFALNARKDAIYNRQQSEGLVEYMLTDLKDKLEPVGRLDVLDSVGARVLDYYNDKPAAQMSQERLARQARARHLIAQVALSSGQNAQAREQIETAAKLTESVLKKAPNDPKAIFAHAQSVYWVGQMAYSSSDFDKTEENWRIYRTLGRKLYGLDRKNFDWVMEAAWGELNLGTLAVRRGQPEPAIQYLNAALELFGQAKTLSPENANVDYEMANTYAWLADAALFGGPADRALGYREQELAFYDRILKTQPSNSKFISDKIEATLSLAILLRQTGDKKRAEQILREIRPIAENLAALDTKNIDWQRALYLIQILLIQDEIEKGQFNMAKADFARLNALKPYLPSSFFLLSSASLLTDETIDIYRPLRYAFLENQIFDRQSDAFNEEIAAFSAHPQDLQKRTLLELGLLEDINAHLGEKAHSQRIAEIILSQLNDVSLRERFLDMPIRQSSIKIQALLDLGRCERAEQVRKALEDRGYHIEFTTYFTRNCRDWPQKWKKKLSPP